jgi:hypothetical protein
MERPFTGQHQLCAELLDSRARSPGEPAQSHEEIAAMLRVAHERSRQLERVLWLRELAAGTSSPPQPSQRGRR